MAVLERLLPSLWSCIEKYTSNSRGSPLAGLIPCTTHYYSPITPIDKEVMSARRHIATPCASTGRGAAAAAASTTTKATQRNPVDLTTTYILAYVQNKANDSD